VKQSVGVESLQQLQDVDVSPENGIDQALIEAPKRGDLEWAWLLWVRRQLLWRFTVRGFVIATIIVFLIPKEYESTTRLMPPDSSGSDLAMMAAMAGKVTGSSSLGGPSALGGIASDLLGMQTAGALWTNLLRSQTVQDRIIDRFDLRKVYRVRYWELARNRLTKETDVLLDRRSGVLVITVTDRDPKRAAAIAHAYVDELDRIVAAVSTSAARRERIFIEQRLKTVKQDLDTVSQEFSEYSSKNATLDVKDQGVAMVEAAAVLQGQLIAAQSELDGLEQIYTSTNVRVRSLQARIDELQKQLKKLGGDPSNPGADDPRSQAEFPSIRRLPLLGVRWADLFRQVKIQETVYELLTEQYELTKIEEAKEIPSVKVFDVAEVPERKSGPHRTILVLLGSLLAFSVGVAWILGDAAWQQMDAENPRKQLAQEVAARSRILWSQLASRWQAAGSKFRIPE